MALNSDVGNNTNSGGNFSGLIAPKLHVVAFGCFLNVAKGYKIVLQNKMFRRASKVCYLDSRLKGRTCRASQKIGGPSGALLNLLAYQLFNFIIHARQTCLGNVIKTSFPALTFCTSGNKVPVLISINLTLKSPE